MPKKSLRVVVRKNPFEAPLLNTQEASTIEIRDADGHLLALVMIIPNHPVFVVSRADHEDFESFVKNTGIKLIDNFYEQTQTQT